MGQRAREQAPTTDPAVVLARLRRAIRAVAEGLEQSADEAAEKAGDEPDTSDEVEWDAMSGQMSDDARALRSLLARPDLQPPAGTTREA